MSDPITDVVDANPVEGLIYVVAADTPYNPSVTYTPGTPASHTVTGSIRNNTDEAMGANVSALFLVKKGGWPEEVTGGGAYIVIAGQQFLIAKFRRRYWQGALNGYLIYLT